MRLFLIVLFSSLSIFNSFSQRPSITIWTDSSNLLIGSMARINLEAKLPVGASFQLQFKPDTSGKLEWLAQGILDSSADGGTMSMRGFVNVIAFDSGTFQAGPLALINTANTDTIFSNVLLLQYRLADVDTTQEIKPIAELMEVPFIWKEAIPYIIALVVALALAAIGYWLYRRWKNRPLQTKDIIQAPKVPIHEIALRQLMELEQEELWQNGREKEYQSRLTDILREYIESRYLLPALESTSTEVLDAFSRQVRDKRLFNMLEQSLTVADYVKFAKGTLTGRENELAMDSAREFVMSTTPQAERSDS